MSDSSLVQMLVAGQNDLSWFELNLNVLKSKFNGKFIAFRNKEVLESDSDLNKLIEKLDVARIDKSSVFIEFITKIKAIL